jgi:hypothetical protein
MPHRRRAEAAPRRAVRTGPPQEAEACAQGPHRPGHAPRAAPRLIASRPDGARTWPVGNPRPIVRTLALACLLAAANPALAHEDSFELWFAPKASVAIDPRTVVELETAQRLRRDPAEDTYYGRLWLGRKVARGITLSAGAERRFDGDRRETRLLEQVSYPLGPLAGRTRLEQRFLSDDPRTAWRLRQRLGGVIPLRGTFEGWELAANAEGFFTLRAGKPGGQTGLTGLRTYVGFTREVGKVELSLGYYRTQTIRAGAEDRVAHAPTLGVGFQF